VKVANETKMKPWPIIEDGRGMKRSRKIVCKVKRLSIKRMVTSSNSQLEMGDYKWIAIFS
jgi:hypothetical protein